MQNAGANFIFNEPNCPHVAQLTRINCGFHTISKLLANHHVQNPQTQNPIRIIGTLLGVTATADEGINTLFKFMNNITAFFFNFEISLNCHDN